MKDYYRETYSFIPTIPLMILTSFSTVITFSAKSRWISVASVGVMGLSLGLSGSFRLSNLFLSVGPTVVIALRDFCESRHTDHWWRCYWRSAVFLTALSVGLAPVLIFNYINMGSPFQTTYSPYDTVQIFSWQLAWNNLTFYLGHSSNLIWLGVLLASFCPYIYLSRKDKSYSDRYIVAVILINLSFGLSYFLTHEVVARYYLLTTLLYVILVSIFAISCRKRDVLLSGSANKILATKFLYWIAQFH
jgi:hypothetical protein